MEVVKLSVCLHGLMRKYTAVLLLIIIAFFHSQTFSQTNSNWKWLHPKPQSNWLRWCHMWNADNWYFAGHLGTFMKTSDRGNTWFITHKAGRYLHPLTSHGNIIDAHFFNMNTGLVCGQSGIMKTTDAGISWDSIPGTFTPGGWYNLFFLNNNTGYSASYSFNNTGRLIKTTNGGNTWIDIAMPSGNYYDIYTPDNILIIVSSLDGNIQRSTNGGLNWQLINTGVGPRPLWRLCFINRDTGFVSGSAASVALTTNGGLNWTNVNNGLPFNGYTDIDFKIVNGQTEVYLTGNYSNIYKTTNLGQSWDTVGFYGPNQLNLSLPYYSTFLGGGDTILTVGFGGSINIRYSPSNRVFVYNGLKFASDNNDLWVENETGRIWVVGAPTPSGTTYDQIMHSTDGGITWSIQPHNSFYSLNSICMLNSLTGYIAGLSGTILKTINGGLNWQQLPSPSGNIFFKVDFIDVNTGWVFGNSGSIYKTTNGGINWQSQISTVTNYIRGADMIDANTGWFTLAEAGPNDTSMVRKTTDGGNTWIKQYSNSYGGAIHCIKMLNANTGYLAGYEVCRKTTNGGTTWDTVPVPYSSFFQIHSLSFADSVNGIMTDGNITLKTSNGGQSWIIDVIGAYAYPGSIQMVNANTSYIAGINASVLKYDNNSIGIIEWQSGVPKQYELYQNFPNPFNPATTIKFAIPKQGKVSLKVYDITGREVKTILDNMSLNRGTVTHQFDGSELASGVYFYSLYVNGEMIDSKKMVLVK